MYKHIRFNNHDEINIVFKKTGDIYLTSYNNETNTFELNDYNMKTGSFLVVESSSEPVAFISSNTNGYLFFYMIVKDSRLSVKSSDGRELTSLKLTDDLYSCLYYIDIGGFLLLGFENGAFLLDLSNCKLYAVDHKFLPGNMGKVFSSGDTLFIDKSSAVLYEMCEKNDDNTVYNIKIPDFTAAVKKEKNCDASVWFTHKNNIYWEPEVLFQGELLGIQSCNGVYQISHGYDRIRKVSEDCRIGTLEDKYFWVRDKDDLIVLNSSWKVIFHSNIPDGFELENIVSVRDDSVIAYGYTDEKEYFLALSEFGQSHAKIYKQPDILYLWI